MMTSQELQAEFIKAGKQSIHSINGSQQKALMTYLSIIGTRNNTKSPAEAMQIIWDSYQKSYDKDRGLALYLNTQMTEEF